MATLVVLEEEELVMLEELVLAEEPSTLGAYVATDHRSTMYYSTYVIKTLDPPPPPPPPLALFPPKLNFEKSFLYFYMIAHYVT